MQNLVKRKGSGKRLLDRSRRKRRYNIKMDFIEILCKEKLWFQLARDRVRCAAF